MSDCISREQAIKSAECIIKSNSEMKTFCILRMLKELPSVSKNDDCISRQAVLEMAYDMSEIDGEHFDSPCFVVDVDDIKKLPSVIEDIKSEILSYKDDKIIHAEVNEMIDIVLDIIDKHISGKEQTE